MKFVPNTFLSAAFVILVLLLPTFSKAMTLLDDPPPPPAPPTPPPVPIDGGIAVLIVFAVFLGCYKVYTRNLDREPNRL